MYSHTQARTQCKQIWMRQYVVSSILGVWRPLESLSLTVIIKIWNKFDGSLNVMTKCRAYKHNRAGICSVAVLVVFIAVVVNICEGQLTCKLLVARFISHLISAANWFVFFTFCLFCCCFFFGYILLLLLLF